MEDNHSNIFEEEKSNKDFDFRKAEKNYKYVYNFDIKYETLKSIIKDFQMVSQLIKFIKEYQINDLIFIKGNSTSEIDAIFYLKYRKMIDFYTRVLDFKENDNFLKITYHVYKTKPICKNFGIIFSLYKNEKMAKLEIEIIPPKGIIISEKILNIIYNEFDYNFLYLSLAIKLKKEKLVHFNSAIIKNEFFVLSQIVQNTKLIEYLINRKLIKINDITDDNKINLSNKDKNIHLNDIYKTIFNKQKGKNQVNDISFKIINIKSKEGKLQIKLKLLLKDKEKCKNDSNQNSLYNIITLTLTKITTNSTFIFINCVLDSNYEESVAISIKKTMKKILSKIEKLSEISKKNLLSES